MRVGCPLCQQQFDGTESRDDLLKHLLEQHKLVIADVNMVANFKKYVVSVGRCPPEGHLWLFFAINVCLFIYYLIVLIFKHLYILFIFTSYF